MGRFKVIYFSVAIDVSTDITDVAVQVRETLTVSEEFFELVPIMDTSTAQDIFRSGQSGLVLHHQPDYRQ